MPFNADLVQRPTTSGGGFNPNAVAAPSSNGFNPSAVASTPSPRQPVAQAPSQPAQHNPLQRLQGAVGGWLHQQGQESAQARQRAAAIADPFAPEKALLHPAAAPVGAVLGFLDRGRQAVQAGLSGHPGQILPALGGSLPHAQSEANRGTIKGAIAHGFNPTNEPDDPSRDNPVQHLLRPAMNRVGDSVANFAIDSATDPTTYLGGSGLLEQGYKQAARHALPAALKGADAVGQAAVKVGRKFGGATGAGRVQDRVNDIGHVASGVYKASVPAGKLKLEAAKDFGAQGNSVANRMISAKNFGKSYSNALGNTLIKAREAATHGLSPEDEMSVYQAYHDKNVESLPEHLQPRAQALKEVFDTHAHLAADRQLKADMKRFGFQVPDYAKPFDTSTRSLMRSDQYRGNYLPTKRDPSFEDSLEGSGFQPEHLDDGAGVQNALELRANKKTKPSSKDLTDTHDPNLNRRQDNALLAPTVEEQRDIIDNRLRSGARAIAARDTGRRATQLFNGTGASRKLVLGPNNVKDIPAKAGSFSKLPGYIKDHFTEKYTKPEDRTELQKAARGFAGISHANQSAMFISPVRHMLNIATLGTLADPSIGGALQTAKTFAKIVGAPPERKYAELKDAIDAGVVGVPADSRTTLDSTEGGLVKHLSDMTMKTPIISHAINGVRKLYTMSGEILWSFDDASKATRFKRLVAKGEHPADAAAQTNAELIDYANKSEFTNMLKYLAPFATYRSKLPGAIARNVIQHPERALTVNRVAPALAGGYQQAGTGPNGKPQGLHSNLPLAEVMRGGDDPEGYARSTLGALPKMIGSAASVFDSDQYPHYLTYGQSIDNPGDIGKGLLMSALDNAPGVEPITSAAGLSQFPDKGLQGAISGQLGLSLGRIPISEAIIRKAMEDEQKKGYHPTRAQEIKYLEKHGGG